MNHEPYQQASQGLLWSGAALIILGTLTILSPLIGSLAIVIAVGVAALASGVVYVVQALYDKEWSGFFWSLSAGIIAIIAGGLLVFRPMVGISALTLTLAIFLFAQGIAKSAVAASIRQDKGWGWLLASGIAGIVLGVMIWYLWWKNPVGSPIWILSLLFGIDLLIAGWSLVILSHQIRKQGRIGFDKASTKPKTGPHTPPPNHRSSVPTNKKPLHDTPPQNENSMKSPKEKQQSEKLSPHDKQKP